jgi:hypothetical protein
MPAEVIYNTVEIETSEADGYQPAAETPVYRQSPSSQTTSTTMSNTVKTQGIVLLLLINIIVMNIY